MDETLSILLIFLGTLISSYSIYNFKIELKKDSESTFSSNIKSILIIIILLSATLLFNNHIY